MIQERGRIGRNVREWDGWSDQYQIRSDVSWNGGRESRGWDGFRCAQYFNLLGLPHRACLY
jgi:hypothetical protein